MKTFLLLLTAAASPFAATAQSDSAAHDTPAKPAATNAPVAAPPLFTERPATEIFSDRAEFDLKTRVAVYIGNVRVVDPQMKLTCDTLTARVPEGGGRVNSIVAQGNVVIDAMDKEDRPIHATSEKAVYVYKVENSVTNETIELTGKPHIQSESISGTGEPIVWDRVKNTFHGSNLHMVFQRAAKDSLTNAPAASNSATNNTP